MIQPIQGVPYVPGVAAGPVRFGSNARAAEIMVIQAADLSVLRGEPAGIVVVDGAPLSHAMLRLFSIGCPAVSLDAEQSAALQEGTRVLLDGSSGLIHGAGPDEQPCALHAPESAGRVETVDGTPVELRASVSNAQGAALARERRAAALGLVRSEYLEPASGTVPDEPFYRASLDALCRAAAPLPVTVRLADFGVSKRPAWLPATTAAQPLGFQGVRWFDQEPVASVVRAQVRAMARLSGQWDLRLLLPFVTGPEECIRWRDWAEAQLPAPVPIGAMAETPAAIFAMAELLEVTEFVAIGCNDLMQGLFEADRDLPAMRSVLNPYAPAVFRCLRIAADLAGNGLERVQVCGLLPQLPSVLPVLIGLGFRAYSVEPMLLPWLAATVSRTDAMVSGALARSVCAAPDAASVRRLLELEAAGPWRPVRRPAHDSYSG